MMKDGRRLRLDNSTLRLVTTGLISKPAFTEEAELREERIEEVSEDPDWRQNLQTSGC